MGRTRLEAFSDGVFAIIITIMVLEIKIPHGAALADLLAIAPKFLAYLLSFVMLGIYWGNHHHLIHTVKKVNAKIIWANLNLLFWLSLFSFATAWVGENPTEPLPTLVYSVLFLFAGASYSLLQFAIISTQGENSILKQAHGRDIKPILSVIIYAAAAGFAYVSAQISQGLIVFVAIIWLIPSKKIEKLVDEAE